jgi:hypothetical protein
MKKVLALAALLALVCVGNSYAGVAPAQRWVDEPNITWRRLGSGVNVDSMVIRHGTAAAGFASLDTSVAIPLAGFEVNYDINGKAAAVDTTLLFIFHCYPTANAAFTAGTGDSLGVATQVSMDGQNWTALSPTQGNSGAGAIITLNSTNVFNVCLPTTGTKGFSLPFKQFLAATSVGNALGVTTTATAPTDGQFLGWRFVRFIISPNRLNGEWRAWISHWTSQGTSNQ